MFYGTAWCMCVIAWLQEQFGPLADPFEQCMQTVLKRPLRMPVEGVLRRLDGAARGAYITVAEFRYDGRFGGVADGGDLASQLIRPFRKPPAGVARAPIARRG